HKLFATIAPWYAERNGGYTRIVRLGRRLGDAGETAYLELVKSDEQKERERTDRIAAEETKEKALKAGAGSKNKAEATAAEEKPRRGRKGSESEVSSPAAPSRKRGRTGVKTG